ncbi:MAG: hypothetical protein KDE68_00735 [Rhodocyclaceae bacterium]|nr:hypothetical protein [Rhodocyclaceae bacterium]
MFVLRAVAALALIGIGGAMVLYLLSGDRRYRAMAWTFSKVGLVVVLVFLALLVIERLLAPML